MKKILSIALIICLALTVVGCEMPFADVLPGSALPDQDITVSKPVSTEVPQVTQVPVDPRVEILTKEKWVDTMDTNSTLTFYEDGSGIGTCIDEKRAFTRVEYTLTWEFTENQQIMVKYFYYIEHTTYFKLEEVDGIWHFQSARTPRFYIYESELPAYLEEHPEVEIQRDTTDF